MRSNAHSCLSPNHLAAPKEGNFMMSNSKTTQPAKTIVEVPATPAINVTDSAIVELVKQGGTISSLVLVCVFVWLLTKLIQVAKDD
jgi:hypothetical protein